ncbi:hypothetical protein N1851_029940 [Merluccius polli]|uniref:Uncharacterized protein n=1 Tax=Merluccius polli TaxID=89951 RepID=A0AA47M6F4_MERPO|nr:hypothetical protein N1851_029940 [Merluccius polli]
MLVKVKYRGDQKFVKISEVKLAELFDGAFKKFGIPLSRLSDAKLFDDTKTELDEEVFEEVVVSNRDLGRVYELSFGSTPEDFDAEVMPVSRESSILDVDDGVTVILNIDSPLQMHSCSGNEALSLIEDILKKRPGGDQIIKEYRRTNNLTDATRRKMVNMVVANMTEIHGVQICVALNNVCCIARKKSMLMTCLHAFSTSPSRSVKERYAKGIVSVFPQLKDPFSEKGYVSIFVLYPPPPPTHPKKLINQAADIKEHFYDSDSGTGYLAWRIKTIQKRASEDQPTPAQNKRCKGGPASERDVAEPELNEEQLKEAISLMKHATDQEVVRLKMKQTFVHRQKMIHDSHQSSDVLSTFTRFADVKGLIEQDFTLLFGEETSAKLLEKWPTRFKEKTIEQSKSLSHISIELKELIQAAESPQSENDWDSDLSSLLLLVYLLPPTAQGRGKPGRLSAIHATEHFVVFLKTGNSIQGHLDAITQTRQPYLLAIGTSRTNLHGFFIVIDRIAIPCSATTSLGAFDELFKAHFSCNMYTFIQTTIFNIDVGLVKENPRVIELRSRFLQ